MVAPMAVPRVPLTVVLRLVSAMAVLMVEPTVVLRGLLTAVLRRVRRTAEQMAALVKARPMVAL